MAQRPARTSTAPAAPTVPVAPTGGTIPMGNCRPVRPSLTDQQCFLKVRMDRTSKPVQILLHKTDLHANKTALALVFPALCEWLQSKPNGISVYEIFRDLTNSGWDVSPYHWGQ
jgi:hypothetical protein